MHGNLVEMQVIKNQFPEDKSYEAFGIIKYAVCISVMILVAALCSSLGWISIFPAVLSFYMIEVISVFLFPLMVSGEKNAVLQSAKMVLSSGYFRSLFKVMWIAVFMLKGILNIRSPLRNWYIGCLAYFDLVSR